MRREIHRISENHKARKRRNRLLSGILCAALMLGEFSLAAGAGQIQVTGRPETVTAAESEQVIEENQAAKPGVGSNEEAGLTGVADNGAEQTRTETESGQSEAESGQTEDGTPQSDQPEIESDAATTVTTGDAEAMTVSGSNLYALDENFPNVVYVGTRHGADIESAPTGQTPAYPYATLEDAYENVTPGGIIKIVDSLTVDAWPDNAAKNVTIEGWTGEIGGDFYNNPTILMDGDWILKGDTTFQKLTIKQKTTGNKAVYPEGHKLQIGSGEFENPTESAETDRIAPRVADTFIRDIKNGSGEWFRIGTGPADGINGAHIEEVDVRVYAGGSYVSIESTPGDADDPTYNIINTPNLKNIYIELVGSKENPATVPDAHWYNGMAPAFDGTRLEKVDIRLGYVKFYRTHSLFRTGTDNNYRAVRKVGSFPINYTLDHVITDINAKPEAIAFGEVFTTGDMTINVWESDFQGSTSTFAPGVFGGQCGTIQVNLHNSTLKGIGNYWTKRNDRNKDLKYDKFELVLDNSSITDYTAFQDDVQITMKGTSSLGSLNYYPSTSGGVSTECIVINEGNATISNIDRNPVNIRNLQGAELRLLGTTDKIQNIENQGTIRLEQTQTWQGNYEGGTEVNPGKLIFPTGITLNIQGEVTGKTVASAEQTVSGSQIATILAGAGKKECITWDESLGGTKTEQDGYWMLNLGKEDFAQEGYVYVRYGGSDTNNGTSYNNAVKSLCRAYELAVEGEGTEPKKIVICDAYPFSNICENEVEHARVEKPVVVTTTDGVTNFGAGYGAKLIASTSSTYTSKGGMSLQHSFEFQHITITDNTGTPQNNFLNIYANGYPTVMGEGVELIPYTSIFGGSEKATIKGTRLTILDGTYFHVYGGNYGGRIEGNIELIVKNANFRTTGYGEEDTMSIVGGNMEGAVTGNISVEVTPEEGQEITNVLRIVGGSYGRSSSPMTGNIDMEVSGAVNFREGTPSLVNNAIVGGNFKNSVVTGDINLTVHDITGTSVPYIIGGNGWTHKVNGNITLTVDNVRANSIIGGCGWTYSMTNNGTAWGAVTGDIVLNIGQNSSVQVDSIYGCSGDMGASSSSTGNNEYKPNSMTMNLGQVKAGTISGGLKGITVSDDVRRVLSLNLQRESRIRELLEFADINVEENAVLIYDGITLTGDTLVNNGTIQYQEGTISVNSDYHAGENARIKLNSHTTVTHEKKVSGKTAVSSVAGNRALAVRAKTEQIVEEDKESVFYSESTDTPLTYREEQDMSIWEFDPLGAGTRDFVYVDGESGDDAWSGTKPDSAEEIINGEGDEPIVSGPVQTLERAYEMIKDGGSIIICGKTEISRWPNVQKKAFITSDASLVKGSNDSTDYRAGNTNEKGAENTGLFFKPGVGSKYLLLEDDLTLRNLDFQYEYDGINGGIDADGNTLVIGDKSDTGTDVTKTEPDVKFYKIQDGQRRKPDTFMLIGGGITRNTIEQIHLEIYNTEVKAVIGLWGGQTENEQTAVEGDVKLVLQDCKTSKGLHYCSYDKAVDEVNTTPYYQGGYGSVAGNADISVSVYDPNTLDSSSTYLMQLRGIQRVKNRRDGKLYYLNHTKNWLRMDYRFGMFHAAGKSEIIYESNGEGYISLDRFYPVDGNTGKDGEADPEVEITLLGNVRIGDSDLSGYHQTKKPSVTLNLGNETRGSKGIEFVHASKQLVSMNIGGSAHFKSYRINYYPGADVKFDLGRFVKRTTEDAGFPVVVLHDLRSDANAVMQTEYIIDEPDFVDDAVLECDNVKVSSSIDMGEGDKQLDLRLINGASYTYNRDDFLLNGSLTLESGTQLDTNGTVFIEKDLNLKENAVFPIENFLTVKGKINSEKNASLLVNNEAIATFGGASGETRVDFNGIAGEDSRGYFVLQAEKGDVSENFAKDRFTGGADRQGTEINLTYDGTQNDSVTWTYGSPEPLDEVFLDEGRGSDENSGNRPGQAVQTFAEALQKAAESMEASGKNGATIVISGKYTFRKERDGQISEGLAGRLADKQIVVTQKADSAGAVYRSEISVESGFEVPCSLIFQDIRLTFSGTAPELYAGGKALIIGENVTVLADRDYPAVYGGHETGDVTGDTNVKIYSGTWFRVYGGSKSGNVKGNTYVTLGDAQSQSAPEIRTEKEDDNFIQSSTNAVFGGSESGGVEGTAHVHIAYGQDYGYVFGGGLDKDSTVHATEVTVDHPEAKLYRIYGGSPNGDVAGQAQVNFVSGIVSRIYGGGIDENATVASTVVNVGITGKEAAAARVTDYLRGSGERGGVTGQAVLNIQDGALIEKNCKAAAGGYTGGVAKSILNISGGEVQTDIYAGGAGEFKVSNGTILDEIDPTKGVVTASEVHVSGGIVSGSVYGGGNKGSVGTAQAGGTRAAGHPAAEGEASALTTAEITGGVITGDFYGGGSLAPTYGNISMTLNMQGNARIDGGVYGGGKGCEPQGDKPGIAADVAGETRVTVKSANVGQGIYGGCNLNGSVESAQMHMKSLPGCSVYGGGFGAETYVENTNVLLALPDGEAASAEAGAAYGGGEQGRTGTSHVTVQNWIGNVYGGGRGAAEEAGIVNSVKNFFRTIGNAGTEIFAGESPFVMDGLKDANTNETHVTIAGTLVGNAYGGGELATVGTVAENATVAAKDAAVAAEAAAEDEENAAAAQGVAEGEGGGADENAGADKPVTYVVIEPGAKITGNVYGGGKGYASKDYARIEGDTSVIVNGGSVQLSGKDQKDGCIFGGGEIAPVAGDTNVTVTGGTVTNVFGGNDRSGSIDGHTNVTIAAAEQAADRTNVQNVYGGGRDAAYSGKGTQVVIADGNVENAFGGGYGESAVCEYTSLTLRGGRTNIAFAGGNASTVSGKAVLTVDTGAETVSADEARTESQGSTGAEETVSQAEKAVLTVFAGNNRADMDIQPQIHLKSGKIGTFYGGGNQGNMTLEGGLHYGEDTFGSKEITIATVYGGCNQADVTGGVTLELTDGIYGEVYGGNNVSGQANQSHVILNGEGLQVTTVYGGGNRANIANASVTALAGNIETLYGGGNAATATKSVRVAVGQQTEIGREGSALITDLYCGNNQAVMSVAPQVNLQKGIITSFHGGGNQGAMDSGKEKPIELAYTFDSADMKITDLYGGGREADVNGSVTLTLAGANIDNVYGGCNESGQVDKAQVIVDGDNTDTVYGGGRGAQTVVDSAQVRMQNGRLKGNLYGGSGDGRVQQAEVIVREADPDTDVILIQGSVYGGGYGESSVVGKSIVTIDMELAISDQPNDTDADVIVKEAEAVEADEEEPSGETKTEVSWVKPQLQVSRIEGSVYGGGDMGKVGIGRINQSANTAEIDEAGTTEVHVSGGYINGSVFGGGSGTPAEGVSYTAYMGTVFGSCAVDMTGGYVAGSIYGCGHQSRVYAPQDQRAAVVNITETSAEAAGSGDFGAIIIGTSVFGGGNKGEGNNQNASVYTVVGDTQVNLTGIEDKKTSTGIYFLSDSKGGVYGDGNLCLVNGERVVNLTDFNYGSENKALLKTFYSLQRADEVNLIRSRVVLRGAKDLVDETADDTEYSINRVGQLNMKDSSALKLTTVVNLLGGLASDQNPDTVYIDRGNNGTNKYDDRGGEAPKDALTEEQTTEYRKAYLDFLKEEGGKASEIYTSFNVVSVANGSYLEIKKSDTEYGNVTGLFTLELLHANPGEGGGFVYAEIGNGEEPGSTGDFICTTPNADPGEDGSVTYMNVQDTVGGYSGQGEAGDYTYYYWYIKGGRYTYKTQLKGYIGTTETEFDTAVNLTELQEGYAYILNKVTGAKPVDDQNSSSQFCTDRFVDHWKEGYEDQDKYAIEVRIVPGGNNEELKSVSLGFLSYGKYGEDGSERWGIKKNAGTEQEKVIIGTYNENEANPTKLKENDVYRVLNGTTGLSLQFVLHKGAGVTVEFKDVPVNLTFDVLKVSEDGNGYEPGNGKNNAHLTVNTYTSITRLVPTQAAYISSGRLYAGVSSDIPVNITKDSAFTAQFITKFVPSAFNTSNQQNQIKEVLTTSFEELYLLDQTSGIGFTAVEKEGGVLELQYATEGNLSDYTLTRTDDGYQVTYTVKGEDTETVETHDLEVTDKRHETMYLPKGTVITLVAQIDDIDPTYWYYYCTKEQEADIPLSHFRRMGTTENDNYSFEKASDGKISPLSSNRVTENLTFVFDFSNVSEETADNDPWMSDENVTGALRLKHLTTIGSIKNVDIMDYVSSTGKVNEDGTAETLYTREYPAVSNTFNVSKEETGLEEFAVKIPQDAYFTKDTYPVEITIVEDKEVVNTQYGEREYAVVLQQIDGTGQVIPFPEGTLFKYQGQNIIAGNQNRSVILPVKKAGEHTAQMETTLEGFESGEVTLRATLYSSSVASYYNSLATNQKKEVTFTVTEKPEAAVRITQEDSPGAEPAGQIFAGGDTLSLTVECQPVSETYGTVGIFRYERGRDSYSELSLTEVFADAEASFAASGQSTRWQAPIKDNAPVGTYRLEFKYEDKTEYWDFVIR